MTYKYVVCRDCDTIMYSNELATRHYGDSPDEDMCPYCKGSYIEALNTCALCGEPCEDDIDRLCVKCQKKLQSDIDAFFDSLGENEEVNHYAIDYIDKRWGEKNDRKQLGKYKNLRPSK